MKTLLFATLLMITSTVAFSQEQPQPTIKFPVEDIKLIQSTRFKDYADLKKEIGMRIDVRSRFQPKTVQNHQMPSHPMQPKPEAVIIKNDKVIVIFDKKDFEKLNSMAFNRNRNDKRYYEKLRRGNPRIKTLRPISRINKGIKITPSTYKEATIKITS